MTNRMFYNLSLERKTKVLEINNNKKNVETFW